MTVNPMDAVDPTDPRRCGIRRVRPAYTSWWATQAIRPAAISGVGDPGSAYDFHF
ncbi:hypothetical protein HMPREF9153_0775 [Cutibacterium avidum ATCC 25577]|uniref:Uncharacterized protein n=1 Tax=Cutibacterium avidum ATCC 25577 TaxID=997355 RepID=G4CW68_9ACTN|nr:hypothetical protein HMPREF9153_0775 [Cutibacterium avidum ATCC 25577]